MLRGTQQVGIPQGHAYEQSKPLIILTEHAVLERKLYLRDDGSLARRDGGLLLQKGVQDFEFLFILPTWAATYERCKYGRTRYFITAKAHGAGRGGGAVTTNREIFPIQQLTEDGGPTPFELSYRSTHECLGSISLELSAVSLTVGGILHLRMMHPHPSPELTVYMICVFVEQQFELHDAVRGTWVSAPLERTRIWSAGSVSRSSAYPLYKSRCMSDSAAIHYPTIQALNASLEPAERRDSDGEHGYVVDAVIRMPDDNTLRPSTARGARTDIRVSHELAIEVLFSRTDMVDERPDSETFGKEKVQVFSMKKHAELSSCVLTYDALHLPPYSAQSPNVSIPQSRASSPTPRPTGHVPLAESRPPSPDAQAERRSRPRSSTDADRSLRSALSLALPSTMRSLPGSRLASREPSPTRHAGREMPKELPAGTPWVISNIRRRTGDTHHICICGQSTDSIVAAESRLVEGAPTAPGAWAGMPDSSPRGHGRTSSQTQAWLRMHEHARAPEIQTKSID